MNTGRLIPLSGVVAVVVIFAGLAAAGNAPNVHASIPKIVTYYGKHTTAQTMSGVLLSLGALLFLIFAATFAARLRETAGGWHGASALCLLGAAVLVIGLTVYAGLAVAMADVVGHIDGTALQALNVLADDAVFVFLITVGSSAFLLGAAAASLVTTLLPRWLGWFAIVFAVVGAIPSHVLGGTLDHIGLVAFAGLGIWTFLSSLLLARSPDPKGRLPSGPTN